MHTPKRKEEIIEDFIEEYLEKGYGHKEARIMAEIDYKKIYKSTGYHNEVPEFIIF